MNNYYVKWQVAGLVILLGVTLYSVIWLFKTENLLMIGPILIGVLVSFAVFIISSDEMPEGDYSKEHLIVGKQYQIEKASVKTRKDKKEFYLILSDKEDNIYHFMTTDDFPGELGSWFYLNHKGNFISL